VGVGYEDMIDLQELPRRQRMQIAEIKQKSVPPELEFHVNTRIPVRIIDQVSTEQGLPLFSVPPFPFPEKTAFGYLSFYRGAGNTKMIPAS